MPSGVYLHTKGQNKKISASRLRRKEILGYINSPETRERIKNSKIGVIATESHRKNQSIGLKRAHDAGKFDDVCYHSPLKGKTWEEYFGLDESNRRRKELQNIKLRRVKRICPVCVKEFEVINSSDQKFCSQKCVGFVKRKERESRICLYCKAEFVSSITSDVKYCGLNCYHLSLKEISINRWKDLEYKNRTVSKMMKSNNLRSNKKEIYLNDILFELFPFTWKYVGNGQIIIGGKCPDFINVNGKKLIIELYGDYWHANPLKYKEDNILIKFGGSHLVKDIWEGDRIRLEKFKEFGYDCLIIWESELMNKKILIEKIISFMEVH